MTILTEWAITAKAFHRNRMPVGRKVIAAALCSGGYSYREVSRMLSDISYIAARDAYVSMVTSLPRESKRYRRAVAIDGSDAHIDGRDFHVWLARDVDTGEIMQFQASPSASAEDGARFLASVAAQCTNRPFVRLGLGENSPRGLLNLDLYFQSGSSQSILGRLGRLFLGNN